MTRHVYAGLETLEEYLSCDAGVTYTLAREFVWGDRFPQPLAMVTHGGPVGGFGGSAVPENEAVLHYLHDILGSVVALTDSAGRVVERYTYDPYGEPAIEPTDPATGLPLTDVGGEPRGGGGSLRLAASGYGNPFLWTGQRYDAGVRLYHFLYRGYSPRLGRWLQRDPLGYVDGVGLYEYVASAPQIWTDQLGLRLRVAGQKGDKRRGRVEDLLQKLCPQAHVDDDTGVVTIKPPCSSRPTSGPTTTDSDGQACYLLRTLIEAEKDYIIQTGGVQSGKLEPGDTKDNILVRFSDLAPTFTVDGKWRPTEVWEVLWHELVHALRREQGRFKGAGPVEERETIEETNELRKEYNEGRLPKDQILPRPLNIGLSTLRRSERIRRGSSF